MNPSLLYKACSDFSLCPHCITELSGKGQFCHGDVIKWKHFPLYWPFVRGIHRSPVNSPHEGQWRVSLMFSLICARINGWVNNREAGDLRRHRAHYDVTVMIAKRGVSWVSRSRLFSEGLFRLLQKINNHVTGKELVSSGFTCNSVIIHSEVICRCRCSYHTFVRISLWLIYHYSDVTMSAMASQITSKFSVRSTICSGVHQREHQSSASLVFCEVNPSTGDRWIPLTNSQLCRKCFHVMTSHVFTLGVRKYFPRYWPFVLHVTGEFPS